MKKSNQGSMAMALMAMMAGLGRSPYSSEIRKKQKQPRIPTAEQAAKTQARREKRQRDYEFCIAMNPLHKPVPTRG